MTVHVFTELEKKNIGATDYYAARNWKVRFIDPFKMITLLRLHIEQAANISVQKTNMSQGDALAYKTRRISAL
ncbi:hypothetical protein ACNR9Q_05345 [Maribacter sp. X9]|uniref:hypothetical protein n=1 Tax=Maribacter sp. X9 TaxID=3402159 RepID=UPI003AF343ED